MRNARKYFRLHKVSLVKILKRREALKIFTPKSSIKENGGSFLKKQVKDHFLHCSRSKLARKKKTSTLKKLRDHISSESKTFE